MSKRRLFIAGLMLVFWAFFPGPVQAQQDPALGTAITELLESYLKEGPTKQELGSGAALANWAILEARGLPELQTQPGMNKGSWGSAWAPLNRLLQERGFAKLRPLQALTLWEETRKSPARFVRVLGREGLLDPKEPKERNKGIALREAIENVRGDIPHYRCSARFETAGWSYTGTASVSPSDRIVRLALRGSQPCKISGSARISNLNLKGRLFEDRDSPSGVKVQLLEHSFSASGCELDIRDRINVVKRLSGGGEAKVSATLDLRVRDDRVSGRFQLDMVSRQAGVALLTGRAIYALKGEVDQDGTLDVQLAPVSSSGNRVLRQLLEKPGNLKGVLSNSKGSGLIHLPVLKDSLEWSGSSKNAVKRSK